MNERLLIIFDVDGTLFQSHLVTVPAIQETFAAFGLRAPDHAAVLATFGIPVEVYEAWIESPGAAGRGRELVEATNRREIELIRTVGALYPGAREVLGELKAAGHLLAVCSNASVAYLDAVLETFALRPFFEVVRCIGQGFENKTAMVRDIMQRVAMRPAVVVGDRDGDVAAAHANGAIAVAAAYGFGCDVELAHAEASIGHIDELPDVVERLRNE